MIYRHAFRCKINIVQMEMPLDLRNRCTVIGLEDIEIIQKIELLLIRYLSPNFVKRINFIRNNLYMIVFM